MSKLTAPADLAPALTAAELAAAVRFVAKEAPHLALALVWSIVTNPDGVAVLRDAVHLVEPAQLSELAALDPALDAAVQSSGPARLRRGQGRSSAVVDDEVRTLDLAQLTRRTAPRLTLRARRPRAGETLALSALALDLEVDVESIVEAEDDDEPETAT